MKRSSQQGVALVITLILLSVITFMAITFLVLSRHEGEQVDTLTQQNVAKFAAVGVEQQAVGQIIANMLGQSNGYNSHLVVSTNYVSQFYDNGGIKAALTNVQYYDKNLMPLGQADQQQMLNNLLYLPRAPVFIVTNRNQTNPEFRFFHDLNGNGVYDTNGTVIETDFNNKNLTNSYTGDPEWIGFLEHPEQRHSASNFFLSRGAFIAIPIGNTLDINFIHNQAKYLNNAGLASPPSYDGFYRNEGVGTWEINLAAFLEALNTNIWGANLTTAPGNYVYSTSPTTASTGTNFFDAASIVQYRYGGSLNTLSPFQNLYSPQATFLFSHDNIDGYATGPLMTNLAYPTNDNDLGMVPRPWSGADNPGQMFGSRDAFTSVPGLIPGNPLDSFTNRLRVAGTLFNTNSTSITNSYNRYTFYRMLDQLGFASAPEPSPYPAQRKLHLNYANVNGLSATNFVPWTPAQFFTNAADRMLRAEPQLAALGINITNIQIYPTNFYTPAVHRILQLAANIYDASTNKNTGAAPNDFDYPSVFRPVFKTTGSGANAKVFVVDYFEVSNNVADYLSQPLDLRRNLAGIYDVDTLQQPLDRVHNVYGVPYVIGARKGFPALDKFSMSPVIGMSRKLQIVKAATNTPINLWHIDTQYNISVSNFLAVELWNSYSTAYPRTVRLLATNDMNMALTNDAGLNLGITQFVVSNNLVANNPPVVLSNTWAGAGAGPNSANYIRPLITGVQYVTNSLFQVSPPLLIPGANVNNPNNIPTTSNYFTPKWVLTVTNRVRVILQDMPNGPAGAPGRIIDYAELSGVDSYDDINGEMATLQIKGGGPLTNTLAPGGLWSTNIVGTNPIPSGILNQIYIAAGYLGTNIPTIWKSSPDGSSVSGGVAGFLPVFRGDGGSATTKQVPFVVNSVYTRKWTWSANDPLVHYLASDLTDPNIITTNMPPPPGIVLGLDDTSQTNIFTILPDLKKISARYRPWNQANNNPLFSAIGGTEAQLALIDPLITTSDAWQFPTNKYPNVGWLGRVHRGTPWQTVYLKSTGIADPINWQKWTGDTQSNYFGINDPAMSQPVNDWKFLDLFTTAPNDNASRGQLSVNQSGSAAWAAVLEGVIVLSNTPTSGLAPMAIDPTNSLLYTPPSPGVPYLTNTVEYIAWCINSNRAGLTNQGGVYNSSGQILGTPQLTVSSPYINAAGNTNILSDAVYERIPQQIMSLVRLGSPRYVIFAYGQSLKPADRSIVQSGPFFGMCTNYQITGEVLTRTVVRFDNAPAAPIAGQPVPSPRAVVESFSIVGPDQ